MFTPIPADRIEEILRSYREMPDHYYTWIREHGHGELDGTDLVILEKPAPLAELANNIQHEGSKAIAFARTGDGYWVYSPTQNKPMMAFAAEAHPNLIDLDKYRSIESLIATYNQALNPELQPIIPQWLLRAFQVWQLWAGVGAILAAIVIYALLHGTT